MKEKLKWLSPALVATALVGAVYCLLKYESDYLWKAQELNLFLDTPLYLKELSVKSGWLLAWLGSYFTEFFYKPWLGVATLVGWWLLLMAVAGRTFHVPLKWAVVLLVPVAALLVTDVDLGYWLYYLKLRGHFFAAAIGTTLAVAAVWIFRLLPSRLFLRPAFMVVSTALLYPLAGFYGLLATLLMGVLAWRLDDMRLKDRLATTAIALLCIGIVPLAYYNYVFCETSIENIYWTALPLFTIDKEYPVYYLPYGVLVLSLIVIAALYGSHRETAVRKPIVWLACQVVLTALLVYGVSLGWYRDNNFHKELTMQHLMDQLDWEGMRQEAASLNDEPTRAIVMMKNLALFRLGRQGDTMYNYKTGAKACDAPFPVSMVEVIGVPLYYHYGQYNFGYRWCMEDGVEYGWRVHNLKYVSRCMLVSGEPRIARKYLALLKHTRYYREWATQYERLADPKVLKASTEFAPILHLTQSTDQLISDNTLVEMFLMHQFASNVSNDTLFQEQAVYSALWTKDIATFWQCFFRYAQSHIGKSMPIHLQEAAYLYGQLEKNVDTSKMPFDKSVVQTYNEFMQTARQYSNLSEEQMGQMMYPRFGHTFYYEYYFIRNQKLY
ncbi:MAG: hypothetical protein IJ559_04140 [Prevotella sp.]|nr:hypothetical protein [Prevotella sp.]